MELRKFKSFIILAKELHFAKAAEKLNITQPALSHQIKQLESELGFDLFDSSKRINHRKVVLTEAGVYLLKEIARLIEQFERVVKNANALGMKNKQLSIGIHASSRSAGIFEIVKKLENILPGTTYKIVEFSALEAIQEAVYREDIDFGISLLPIVFKDLSYIDLGTEFLNITMSVHHPLAKYKKVKIEQFRNDKWISLRKELLPAIMKDLEKICLSVGFSYEANIVQEVSSVDFMLGLVDSKLGVAILPSLYPISSDTLISKELFVGENTRLEISAVLAFKKSFNQDLKDLLVNKF